MQKLYHSLSEKDRRRYAAIEALKLGSGGISYISLLFGCDYYTISNFLVPLTFLNSPLAELLLVIATVYINNRDLIRFHGGI